MRKYLLGIVAVVLAIGFSAFTNKPVKKSKFDSVYYQYTGPDQSVTERKKKTNYTNPQTSAFTCSGSDNECAVLVTGVSTPYPANISTLTVNFNSSTGLPESGSNFSANYQKN